MADIRLVDSHCHPDFHHFDHDRNDVFVRFSAAGGRWLVAVAVDMEDLPRLFALAEKRENVFCSVGLHPNQEVTDEPSLEHLCEAAAHPKCVAIGETGMDFFRRHISPEIQEQRFRRHIRAARQLGKPVIVHMREAAEVSLRILKQEGVETCGGIMHCFSSTWDVARQALDMGMFISFAGNVTFRHNEELRDVAARVPAERLLIETDSPYLAPVPVRGKRNEPALVLHVAECLAGERRTSTEHLARTTAANACRAFGVDPSL